MGHLSGTSYHRPYDFKVPPTEVAITPTARTETQGETLINATWDDRAVKLTPLPNVIPGSASASLIYGMHARISPAIVNNAGTFNILQRPGAELENEWGENLIISTWVWPYLPKSPLVLILRTTSYHTATGVDGTLRKAMSDGLDSLTTNVDMNIFSIYDHTTPNYIWNTNCWAASLDWSCVSPWNSQGSNLRFGVLISPCHIVVARHYPPSIGATIRFVSAAGTICTRTVISGQSCVGPDNVYYQNDVRILRLDSDVDEGISFVAVMGAIFEDKISRDGQLAPVIRINQFRKAAVADLNNHTQYETSIVDNRSPLKISPITFDSGGPIFCVVDGKLILMGCVSTIFDFPKLYNKLDEIDAIMTNLGGGYITTKLDLSGYPDKDEGWGQI